MSKVISQIYWYYPKENNQQKTILKTMKKGTVIGSRNFILQKSLEYNGRTMSFTETATIDFNDFLKLL